MNVKSLNGNNHLTYGVAKPFSDNLIVSIQIFLRLVIFSKTKISFYAYYDK